MQWQNFIRLTACVAVFAATGALAQDQFNPNFCANDFCNKLELGHVTGKTPAKLYWAPQQIKDCPAETKKCIMPGSLRPGQMVIAEGRNGDFVAVGFIDRDGTSEHGFMAASQYAAEPVQPSKNPPLSDWVGVWGTPDSRVTIRKSGDMLEADGEGYWPAKNYVQRPGMPGQNEGGFSAKAKPNGNTVLFKEGDDQYDCKVSALLFGPFLWLEDNSSCGGMNVRFLDLRARARK